VPRLFLLGPISKFECVMRQLVSIYITHRPVSLAGKFFAHPFRVLNEISDPSKATSARPRKLGLRPQTVRVALRDAALGLDGYPINFIGPLQERAGLG
jgi:hypothetical protein